MQTFKELRLNLTLSEASEKEVKSFKVGKKSKAVVKKSGSKFSVYIDGELLDKDYKSAKEAEKAAKEFADLMGA
jgi:F0F1-type ATP synthase gamma subunit